MKKAILLLATILLFSCSSSDDNSESSNLLGKWTPEIETEFTSTGEIFNQLLYSDEPCYQMTTFEYKSNGQLIKDSYDYEMTCIQNPTRTYSYTISGTTITVNNDGLENDYRIIQNTNELLKLKLNNDEGYYTIIEFSKVD